jgi:Fe-S-cluster-containing dehydrogenase component
VEWIDMGKVMVIDVTKCYGCQNCALACKSEFVGITTSSGFVGNDYSPYAAPEPDTGSNWMRVDYGERGAFPKTKMAWTPTPCMHCDNAPCIAAATGGAVYKRSDGIVIIDPVKSVGQRQLVASCPYGAIFWNTALNIPQKCIFCAHILDNTNLDGGIQTPRCVNNCATSAISFGEDTDLMPFIKANNAKPLHPEYGTQPRVYYIGLPSRFVTGTVLDNKGENLPGATVTATDVVSGTVLTATTNRFGDFWFEGLGAHRTYSVTISAPGKMTKTVNAYTNTDVDLGDLALF